LEKGVATALIGPSGAGKSTIINLLCRLLEPTAGRILVDGVPLGEIDPVQWRSRIGFAGQDVDLVDGSLAENIRYGAPDASAAEIAEAARLADIYEFVVGLPQGFETKVGSSGLGLSGGQRQRIGLARALVRRPDLLILDEATNAVDTVSEATILELLMACPWKPTVLVVSHRANTLACCQKGVVLDNGRVVEAGPLNGLRTYKAMLSGAGLLKANSAEAHGPGASQASGGFVSLDAHHRS
jgi:subfamily B ATP-binding cassette protein MsbA